MVFSGVAESTVLHFVEDLLLVVHERMGSCIPPKGTARTDCLEACEIP